MSYFFTSESVSEGHPDKIADQISDSILDYFLAYDECSKVAIETLVTKGQVVLAGEVKSKVYLDIQNITRKVINKIGYDKSDYAFNGDSCGIITLVHEQSDEINRGVEKENIIEQGAGDQGMMFGYATDETDNFMPLSLEISNRILEVISDIRKSGKEMTYLRPDAKSQVTIEYDNNNKPLKIETIVISTQHDEFNSDESIMLKKIKSDIFKFIIPKVIKSLPTRVRSLFNEDIKLYINPTGKFVKGGPDADTGLTGRKIIVDTYGGKGAHGGGAFSGKDPSKVDRSAAYAARHAAKNLVAAGVSDEILVQLSYAIGVAKPISIYINTFGKSRLKISDSEISKVVNEIFDFTPYGIEKRLKLRNPIYSETSSYGHMGRKPKKVIKEFISPYNGLISKQVELFTWE